MEEKKIPLKQEWFHDQRDTEYLEAWKAIGRSSAPPYESWYIAKQKYIDHIITVGVFVLGKQPKYDVKPAHRKAGYLYRCVLDQALYEVTDSTGKRHAFLRTSRVRIIE